MINRNVNTWNGNVLVNDTGNVATTLASLTRNVGELVSSSPYSILAAAFNSLTGSAAGNYNAPSFTGTPTLTITPASLTASIANQNKIYGTNDPAISSIGVILSGIINNPAISTWNGTVAINDTGNVNGTLTALSRVAGESVGSYNVTSSTLALSGSAASNYNSVAGLSGSPTLTINTTNLTGSIPNLTKVYGNPDPASSSILVTLGGVINNSAISTWNGTVSVNDTNNVSTGVASYTRVPGETVAGSPYSILSVIFEALNGSAAANYNAPTFTGSPVLYITPAPTPIPTPSNQSSFSIVFPTMFNSPNSLAANRTNRFENEQMIDNLIGPNTKVVGDCNVTSIVGYGSTSVSICERP